jgi:hypothetical protein
VVERETMNRASPTDQRSNTVTERKRLSRRALVVIGIAPAILAVPLLASSVGWLKALPDALALMLTGGVGIFVMAWAVIFSNMFQRRQDEVERASGRYAMQHGFTIGSIVIAVLLLIPPFGDWVIESSNAVALSLKGNAEKAPLIAFVGGFMALTFAQIISAAVVGIIWWRQKS